MRLYIDFRRHEDRREMAVGFQGKQTPVNSTGKAVAMAVTVFAIALAYWGLVLTDIGPMQ